MNDHRDWLDGKFEHHAPRVLTNFRHHHGHVHANGIRHTHWHDHVEHIVTDQTLDQPLPGIARVGENLPAVNDIPSLTLPRAVVAVLWRYANDMIEEHGASPGEDRFTVQKVGQLLRNELSQDSLGSEELNVYTRAQARADAAEAVVAALRAHLVMHPDCPTCIDALHTYDEEKG